mgnify:CR=1 FL=1
MGITKRTVLLALALIATSLIAYRLLDHGPASATATTVTMTDTPCNEKGQSITGKARDDRASLCLNRKANARIAGQSPPPRIVLIGDSITAGWKTDNTEIVNRGIGGQTSQQVLARFRQDVVGLKPRFVHILVGTNDIAGNTGPISPEMFMNNVQSMVDIARANGIEPVIGLVTPARQYDWVPGFSPSPWITRLNAKLKDYARENDLVVADYQPVMTMPDGGIEETLFSDGAHPNKAGYARMLPVLNKAIEEAEARGRRD